MITLQEPPDGILTQLLTYMFHEENERKQFDDMFSDLATINECVTDRQTEKQNKSLSMYNVRTLLRGKIRVSYNADFIVILQQNYYTTITTPCPKKTCDYIFYNNFNNKCPITMIFGIVSSKSMSHRKMVSFPTSPI